MPIRPTDPDKISRYTGSLIRRAQHRHSALWATEVSVDITSVQFAALEVLLKSPGINQRKLGDELGVDRSTIADLVARMVRNHLIERSHDSEDKRSYVLALTPAGQNTLDILRPRVDALEVTLTAGLTKQQCQDLRKLLAIVLSASNS